MSISKLNLNILFIFVYAVGFVVLLKVVAPGLINMRDDFFSTIGLLTYPLSLMWLATGAWLIYKFNTKKEQKTNENS